MLYIYIYICKCIILKKFHTHNRTLKYNICNMYDELRAGESLLSCFFVHLKTLKTHWLHRTERGGKFEGLIGKNADGRGPVIYSDTSSVCPCKGTKNLSPHNRLKKIYRAQLMVHELKFLFFAEIDSKKSPPC
jgi:hypothetical protein